jgi:hypothetical protein
MTTVSGGPGHPHSIVPGIRIRFEAFWCLFGVCFLEALERTSETYETMETSLKRKKIKELFSRLFKSRDLRYGADENPSLSAKTPSENISKHPIE